MDEATVENGFMAREPTALINSGLALQPSHVPNDVVNVTGFQPFDLRHVAELPMVSANADLHCPLKSDIGVMIGFVNLMYERRTLLRPHSSNTMTGGTGSAKFRLTRLNVHRRSDSGRLCAIRIGGFGFTRCQSHNQQGQSGPSPPCLHPNYPQHDFLTGVFPEG